MKPIILNPAKRRKNIEARRLKRIADQLKRLEEKKESLVTTAEEIKAKPLTPAEQWPGMAEKFRQNNRLIGKWRENDEALAWLVTSWFTGKKRDPKLRAAWEFLREVYVKQDKRIAELRRKCGTNQTGNGMGDRE